MYVGSAQTSLEKRIRRHIGNQKKVFWHVDYLLQNHHAKITRVFFKQASKAEECAMAQELRRRSELIKGFGCSDCRCQSHLFRLPVGFVLAKSDVFALGHGWSRLNLRYAVKVNMSC